MPSMRTRARFLLAIAAVVALVVIAMTAPFVRDALAALVAVALVGTFLGLRLLANRFSHPQDHEFDLWGGMTETTDEIVARHRRPGGNPSLPPEAPPGVGGLPDAPPSYQGHPLGDGDSANGSRQ